METPEVVVCLSCSRTFTSHAWECLPWLQYVGTSSQGRPYTAVEVRRWCNCSQPIGRETVVPMALKGGHA